MGFLRSDQKALETYEAIKKKTDKGGGFFAAKKWYKDYIKNKK